MRGKAHGVGQAGWHSYLPTGCGLSELLQPGVGQVSVFTRQVCGWLSVAPGNHIRRAWRSAS